MFVAKLRKIYRRFIHWPWLDQRLYALLDFLTDIYSVLCRFSFPKNYIRRWKLNMLWELYEPETVVLFKKIIKPGMVMVDIGAHIGYFTRIFSKLTGEEGLVYALEADPDNFKLLIENTKHLANVKAHKIAVANRSGEINFYHVGKSGSHSILPNLPQDFGEKKRIIVQANTLDAILASENIARVDIIKMDIEGGEQEALGGMEKTLKNNPDLRMVIEFAPEWIRAAGTTPLKFLQNLASFGFKIYAIVPDVIPPQLIKLETGSGDNYRQFFKGPKDFINLYCVK